LIIFIYKNLYIYFYNLFLYLIKWLYQKDLEKLIENMEEDLKEWVS